MQSTQKHRATFIWITCQFEGMHYWPNAPEGSILNHPHRHIFHVKLTKLVKHDDRDIEFIDLKNKVEKYCYQEFSALTTHSCEDLAKILLEVFEAERVDVSEDGENGASVVNGWFSHPDIKPTDSFMTNAPPENKTTLPKSEWIHWPQHLVVKEELPSMKVKTRCFVGNEVEGPHKGQLVLFVPGCVGPDELQKAWDHFKTTFPQSTIRRIYCGAGNLPYPRNDTIAQAVLLIGSPNVDAEVDSYERIAHIGTLCPIKIISRNPNDKLKVDFIKVIAKYSVIWEMCQVQERLPIRYMNSLDDPLYAKDIDLDY